VPRLTQAGQIIISPNTEPRSLSDLINFTQKSNLVESQLLPSSPNFDCSLVRGLNPCEQALRTVNRYSGTSQVYNEACTKYNCTGGLPVPRSVETAAITVGAGPNGVGVNPANNRVYVANTGTNTVSVIDGNTNTSLGTPIRVGSGPLGVGVNPATNLVYVGSQTSSVVTVINGTTNTAFKNITIAGPVGIGVDPSINRIYVATGSSVAVINGTSNTVLTSISLTSVGFIAVGVGVNPTTHLVYVGFLSGNSVAVINGTSKQLQSSVPVPGMSNAIGIGVNPSTNLVYVMCFGCTGKIAVIDGTSNKFVTTINTPGSSGIGVNPTTNRIYVGGISSAGDFISVINGATNGIINIAVLGAGNPTQTTSSDVAVNPITNIVYVTNAGENTTSVIGQRQEIQEACLGTPFFPSLPLPSDCLIASSTGTIFPATAQQTSVNLIAVSLRSNTTKTGTQMAITIFCDYDTTNSTKQCSAFYVDGNVWSPGQTDLTKSPFIIQNAEPYFYLQFHWWDFANSRIFAWGTWWYGTASNPNWFWGVYWSWRTYVNYYIGIPYIPWWWWSWHWMYWRYWAWWGTAFQT
jgi:YVTN family beta-propeller protein